MKIIKNTQIIEDIRNLLISSRQQLQYTVNHTMVQIYWHIGKMIVEDEQNGDNRAKYGKNQLEFISSSLTKEFGKGFDSRNLRNMRQFYVVFPIWHSVSAKLNWTHYKKLMTIENIEARQWYIDKTKELQIDAKDILRDPYIFDFLNLPNQTLLETDVEQLLIDNLQNFLLELGSGFAFVSRQKRLVVEEQDFYIDLVFYNFKLKCFLLIDLKLGKLTHQDVGQMDTYVRVYDKFEKGEDDNPTIGLILCSDKSQAVAKYSVLSDNKQLFSSKYLPFLPTEEELRTELLRERSLILDGDDSE